MCLAFSALRAIKRASFDAIPLSLQFVNIFWKYWKYLGMHDVLAICIIILILIYYSLEISQKSIFWCHSYQFCIKQDVPAKLSPLRKGHKKSIFWRHSALRTISQNILHKTGNIKRAQSFFSQHFHIFQQNTEKKKKCSKI